MMLSAFFGPESGGFILGGFILSTIFHGIAIPLTHEKLLIIQHSGGELAIKEKKFSDKEIKDLFKLILNRDKEKERVASRRVDEPASTY